MRRAINGDVVSSLELFAHASRVVLTGPAIKRAGHQQYRHVGTKRRAERLAEIRDRQRFDKFFVAKTPVDGVAKYRSTGLLSNARRTRGRDTRGHVHRVGHGSSDWSL